MSHQKLYMVELTVNHIQEEEFFNLLPDHRNMVHNLIYKDIIVNYTVAEDRSKVWSIFRAENESALVQYIEKLPLTRYMDYTYHELMFMEWAPFKMNFSLN
ncbi:MAG: hypothetical protein IPN29_12025 [Saprospiraceae bacterium]|nr:hypothetical protein [Saprospiraceae bacterium]